MGSISVPEEGIVKTKVQERIDLQLNGVEVDKLPLSYKSNSKEEEEMLEYVETFRKQFSQLYRGKFVSTTIRPTLIPFSDLYDVSGCAKFLVDYIRYEPLDLVSKLPDVLQSPTTTLSWQVGNSFDMATLLVSLLLGAGYDAYCVSGYASKEITQNDRSFIQYPIQVIKRIEKESDPEPDSTYDQHVIEVPSLTSKYQEARRNEELMKEKERRRQMYLMKKRNIEVNSKDEVGLRYKRVHCWVLVLPPKREIEEPMFVEPTTGECLNMSDIEEMGKDDAYYFGIETLWNNHNYWFNLQQTNKFSELSFDFNDLTKWEFIFLDRTKETGDDEDDEEDDEIDAFGGKSGDDGGVEKDSQMIPEVPRSWVSQLKLTKDEYERKYPECNKEIQYHNCTVELFTEYKRPDGLIKKVTVFSNPEEDELDDYDEAEESPYQYHDEEGKIQRKVVEVKEYFSHRKDLLFHRTKLADGELHEFFERGRPSDLSEYTEKWIKDPHSDRESDEMFQYEMHFYPDNRNDLMVKRTVVRGHKISEYFEGRSDCVIYRSATFDKDGPEDALQLSDGEKNYPIKKMTQKYCMPPSSPEERKQLSLSAPLPTSHSPSSTEQFPSKLSFRMAEKQLVVEYHRQEGRISASSRVYSKEGTTKGFHADSLTKKPSNQELLDDYQKFNSIEKECLSSLRETDNESGEILRRIHGSEVELKYSVYDCRKNEGRRLRVEEKAEEERSRAMESDDYLSLFMQSNPKLAATKGAMNKEKANLVLTSCLKSFRDRQKQKEKLIQGRLEKENKMLKSRHNLLKKNQDMDKEEEEEHVKFIQETQFKKRILEKRLEKHQQTAQAKISKLEVQLRNDPRLAPFLSH